MCIVYAGWGVVDSGRGLEKLVHGGKQCGMLILQWVISIANSLAQSSLLSVYGHVTRCAAHTASEITCR